MKRLIGLLLFLGAASSVAMAADDVLKVDFTVTGGLVQEGFDAYYASHENDSTFTEQSFSAFGTTVSVLPTWAEGAPNTAKQMIYRAADDTANGNVQGYPTEADSNFNLICDWIGTDLRVSPGDPMKLSIIGLPAGEYSWKSYHNDINNIGSGSFILTVNDSNGPRVEESMTSSNTGDPAAVMVYETVIYSNGVDPVTFEYDGTGATDTYVTMVLVNGFELSKTRSTGAAVLVSPANASEWTLGDVGLDILDWEPALNDPNVQNVTKYDLTFATDPNFAKPGIFKQTISNLTATEINLASQGINLDYDTSYYWRVDSYVTWNSSKITTPNPVAGSLWSFRTFPQNLAPSVTAGDDVLTALELGSSTLTATVDDKGEGDIASVEWEIVSKAVVTAAKQMINRTDETEMTTLNTLITNAGLAEVGDQNFFSDWIGTDARELGNPMALTLKGLPAGTYTWKSYHHDAQFQNGMFMATVFDADYDAQNPGTETIQITNDTATDGVATFETTITANGTDDVALVFEVVLPYAFAEQAFFVMNGFDLTKGTDSMKVDFGLEGSQSALVGCQFYNALHENDASFTEQAFTIGGDEVLIQPSWGSLLGIDASIVNETEVGLAAQEATFVTSSSGTYTIKVTVTDNGGDSGPDAIKSASDTMTVQVDNNACLAAQHAAGWPGFSSFDSNSDCVIDINDFAAFAGQWLNDLSLTEQVVR